MPRHAAPLTAPAATPRAAGATITINAWMEAGASPASWCFAWDDCHILSGEPSLQVWGPNGYYAQTADMTAQWQDLGPGQTMQPGTYDVLGAITWTVCWGYPYCVDYYQYGESGSAQVTVTPTATAVSLGVTPSSGAGPQQTFTFQYTSAAGVGDIVEAWQILHATGQTANSCVVGVFLPSQVVLWHDIGVGGSHPSGHAGSATVLENSQCRVDLSGATVSTAGTTLTVVLPVEFRANYAGPKNVYAYGKSAAGVYGTPLDGGDWTVRARIDSLSPSSANAGQTFTINGLGFGALPNGPEVTVNGTPADVTSWSNTTVQPLCP